MAYVTGLNGSEIVEDVLAQIKKQLIRDCNLRESDSYGRGYSAEISIKIKAFAMDVVEVNQTVNIAPTEEPPVSTEDVTVIPVTLETSVVIDQEEDLLAVRDRIEEAKNPDPEPVLATGGEEQTPETRTKRRYTRRVPSGLEHTPMGDAVDLDKPEF